MGIVIGILHLLEFPFNSGLIHEYCYKFKDKVFTKKNFPNFKGNSEYNSKESFVQDNDVNEPDDYVSVGGSLFCEVGNDFIPEYPEEE